MEIRSCKAGDACVYSPSTGRNKEAILNIVKPLLEKLEQEHADAASKMVLEVACGTGEHCFTYASALPGLKFQPTDLTDDLFESIKAWTAGLDNVCPPAKLDVSSAPWVLPPNTAPAMAIMSANLCHISPWEVTVGLLKGAGTTLRPSGLLMIYGSFKVDGEHTAPSNAEFDAKLRDREPSWGVRDVCDLEATAKEQGLGLRLIDKIEMPANNFILVFRKS
eukprot:gene3845-13908_t